VISLLIPTMNRSAFLERLLGYYAATGFAGSILIGDSSEEAELEAARKLVRHFGARMDIQHYEYPGLNNAQCVQLMLDRVATPYAAFIADDDFLVPDSLTRCTSFLDMHGDYVAAHGEGIVLILDRKGPWGIPARTGHYAQAEISASTAVERIKQYKTAPLSTLFCVHRTATWRDMYAKVEPIRDIAIATEILPCYLSVALGKVKALDGLHVVRQIHAQQYVYRDDPMVWITKRDWQPSFEALCDAVGDVVARIDGIGPEAAREFFANHYRERLPHYLRLTPPSALSRLHARMAGTLRQHVIERRFRLESLRSRRSAYYSDFAQIEGAVGRGCPDALQAPQSLRGAQSGASTCTKH
jgi:glycosyltransferase domain-containing protein